MNPIGCGQRRESSRRALRGGLGFGFVILSVCNLFACKGEPDSSALPGPSTSQTSAPQPSEPQTTPDEGSTAVTASATTPPHAPSASAPVTSPATGSEGSPSASATAVDPAPSAPVPTSDPAAGGAGGAAFGSSGGDAGASDADAATAAPEPFILGADVSSTQEAVDQGARYIDTDGQEKDLLTLLAGHGFNAIRLRVFVDPSSEHGYASSAGGCQARAEPYCDAAHTVEFAQRIKQAGMRLLLDFHYSDTWADPAKQVVPESWLGASTVEELAEHVGSHTRDVLSALAAADSLPDWVQIGNEITPGMLIHEATEQTDCWGNNSVARPVGGSTSNWENLGLLLKAGTAAAREVSPRSKIVLHIENTDDPEGAKWWVDNALAQGVQFDVLGLSCYTEFQGQPEVWEGTFETLAQLYPELEFMIAEYNPERTRANQIMQQLPDGRGLGTFFWEPTQSGVWGQALFSSEGDGVLRANAADFAEFDALRE